MYIPPKMNMDTVNDTHRFIENFSFAIVVSQDFHASHIPLILKKEEGNLGTLYGHVAKANLHANSLQDTEVLIIFSGPHAYISPSWYQQAPAVPTWNYAAVHVKGIASFTDEAQTLKTLQETVEYFDPGLENAETIMPEEFTKKLAKAIVGFKIDIHEIEGKMKLGQHRSVEDQQSVFQQLKKSKHPDSQALAMLMESWGIGLG